MISLDTLRTGLLCLLTVAVGSPLAHAVAPVAPSSCVATAVSATATNATIAIAWADNSTNETQWTIQYSVNNGAYSTLGTVPSTTTGTIGNYSVSWSGAALNTTYHFKVLAFNGTEYSAVSNVTTVGTYDLNGPSNLNVTAADPFNVTMTWEENSTGEAGFAIETKAGTGAWAYLGSVGANVVSVNPINLIAPQGTFSFRVRAFKGSPPTTPDTPPGANVSAYSNISTLTAGTYSLTASAVPGQPVVNLSWPAVLNQSGYRIVYKAATDATYAVLDEVAANVTTYQVTVPLIEPTVTYMFAVLPFIGNSSSGIMGESGVTSVTVDGITSKSGESDIPGALFSHAFTDNVTRSAVSSRTLTGVPSTLTFNSGTGNLSGVFPALGVYTLSYTVNFTDGSHLTQTFYIRVRPAAGPPLVGTLIPAWSGLAGDTRDTPLAGAFSDPEAESAVRVSTNLGTMDFVLFDTATPATVTNFMSYVNAGKYTGVTFHRSVSQFVIQGGGFKGTGSGSNFTSVVTAPQLANEPGIGNVRGTLSMAKTGGNPNSATSQFFVSLNDNRANLDYQNGGFTVFGRVAGNGMAVADAISALPTATYNLFLDGSATATPFGNFPMNANTPPATMDQTQLVKITSATPIPTLSYSITGNTNPAVATASIISSQLHLTALAGGQTTLTVSATDLDNLTTSQTLAVTASDTYTSWASRTTFPNGQSGAGQNPDGDSLNNLQEYALCGDPALASQAPLPTPGKTGVAPAAQFMTLTFPLRKFTTGLSYVVEANNQLGGTWTPVWSSASDPGLSQAQVVSAVDQTDRTVVTIKDSVALGVQPQRFLRVRVTQE